MVAILKTILSLTGGHWSALRSGLKCSGLLLRNTTFAACFWTCYSLCIWSQLMSMSKEGVAAVQPTKNKRKHQLSSGFRRQEMADRTNSSDLEICCTTDVVNTIHHSRQWRLRYFRQGLWRKCQGCQLSSGFSCDTLALLRDPTKTASGFVVAQL